MDASRPIEEINFEFENDTAGEWEFVMISQEGKKGADDEDNEDDDDDEDGEGGGDGEEVLDMPSPWSPKLIIEREKYYNFCPKGEKTVFYKKCTVDFYSECKQVDGIVKRITIYDDYKKLVIKERRTYFKNRRDKLTLRRRFPY